MPEVRGARIISPSAKLSKNHQESTESEANLVISSLFFVFDHLALKLQGDKGKKGEYVQGKVSITSLSVPHHGRVSSEIFGYIAAGRARARLDDRQITHLICVSA